MDWITPQLLIGNYLDAQDLAAIQRHGIRSILSLDGTAATTDYQPLALTLPQPLQIEVVELIDGPGNSPTVFRHAVKMLAHLLRRHAPVLVQCHAGRSRSPAVVATYYMWHEGRSLADAMSLITASRDVIITAGLQEVFDFPAPQT